MANIIVKSWICDHFISLNLLYIFFAIFYRIWYFVVVKNFDRNRMKLIVANIIIKQNICPHILMKFESTKIDAIFEGALLY